jgi:hypothetical protein
MNLDSARELKQSLTESVLHSDTAPERARSLAARAQALSTATVPPFVALGNRTPYQTRLPVGPCESNSASSKTATS